MKFYTIKTAGINDVVTLLKDGSILSYNDGLKSWIKTGLCDKDRLEKEGTRVTLYALREIGISPPLRPIAPLQWVWDEAAAGYYAPAFVESQFVDLIIIFNNGKWELYYGDIENKDYITSHVSITAVRDKAQALHDESVMAEFFA